VIAAGGYPGLEARYDAYKEAAGHEKPLRYQIVTHHHTDHLGGMAEALALGATFVAPENAVANLNTAAGEEIPEERLQILDGELSLGPVEIHDIWSSHAESYALVYVPAANAVFQADHYGGLFVDGPSPAGVSAVTLKAAIERLGLDVDTVLSAHNRKAEPWANFEAAVADYNPAPCPSGRAICR
jgi:glyoxylase-like metal-dependent hydrolase (beta-lactamase superfamily II)